MARRGLVGVIGLLVPLDHGGQQLRLFNAHYDEYGFQPIVVFDGDGRFSDEEIAFYDALAENESAREAMGEPALRVIAHELVIVIKSNVTTDWTHRDSARANIRRHVKRLLRKYGYPPDLQDAAVINVLQQAEALSASWVA